MQAVLHNLLLFHNKIRSIGYLDSMDDYEKRKLSIFNLLNVLGFLIGIFLPVIGLFVAHIQLPAFAWVVTFSPAMISMLVLVFNHFRMHEVGRMCYFTFYPVLTAMVYAVSFDVGIELFFILYGVLSVFFLQRVLYIIFAFSLSLLCYFYVFVFQKNYAFQLADTNFPFYALNHILPAAFIFYALFLIKKENTQYQFYILKNNRELHRVNLEIQKQKEVIDHKASLLEQQTIQLTDLNTLKNKLFSVISHDLKTPLYALRNLFRTVHQYDMPAEEIKQFIPDVVKDLSYTTGLMENLLSWVKCQMQTNTINPLLLEVSEVITETTDLFRLHAKTKNLQITVKAEKVYMYTDRDMISLVLRNLLSNAIKFTPANGSIEIAVTEKEENVSIAVTDTGMGMDPEVVNALFNKSFYTTNGTENETGTGIGLMLCNDFLAKNGGTLFVASERGKGSRFIFTLPKNTKADN
ncbi:MAG TPA: ATP-binding protein [Flavitalea sp.]|nr:ATP-binding protein [Flavitalea sp.]